MPAEIKRITREMEEYDRSVIYKTKVYAHHELTNGKLENNVPGDCELRPIRSRPIGLR